MKLLRFHRAARDEVKTAARHYAGIRPELGGQFYDAIEELLREIRERPALFRIFESPARRHFGSRFPYAVVYVDFPDRIWIVAVMHFKQPPGYWAGRIA